MSQVETNVQMMDKGKVVVVKKGPMQDQINEGVVSLMIDRRNLSEPCITKEKSKNLNKIYKPLPPHHHCQNLHNWYKQLV